MKKKILLARPRAASERWAALLAQSGFETVIEPLLHITPTNTARPAGQFQAVILTSASTPEALAVYKEQIADLLILPCYCVGASTAEAARIGGFTNIQSGTADSAALGYMIIGTLDDKNVPLLHVAGDVVDGKAQDILSKAGFTVIVWPVYSASAAQDFTEPTRALLASGDIGIIPVFSPRSARILVALIEKNRLTTACHHMVAVGLSQAVADVLQTLPWQRLRVAATPNEEGMLKCLQSESVMNLSDTPPAPPAPSHVPHRSKKRGFAWGFLAVLLLSGAGAVALNQCPWLHKPAAENPQTAQNIEVLEDRVRMLESRAEAQSEQPAAQAAQDSNNSVAALTDTVKNLQAQIAQMQSEHTNGEQAAQKWVAAAFAFWDVRSAASEGRAFSTQLAALTNAAENDAVVTAQSAILFSYTAGVPTLTQLRDDLLVHEPALIANEDGEESPAFWKEIRKIMRSLISVHPLHDLRYDTLENALASGDAAAALTAFNALPVDAQEKLAPWHEKLQSRIAVDDALYVLALHFTAPAQGAAPAQGNAP